MEASDCSVTGSCPVWCNDISVHQLSKAGEMIAVNESKICETWPSSVPTEDGRCVHVPCPAEACRCVLTTDTGKGRERLPGNVVKLREAFLGASISPENKERQNRYKARVLWNNTPAKPRGQIHGTACYCLLHLFSFKGQPEGRDGRRRTLPFLHNFRLPLLGRFS
ncbi:hypothetical protein JAAARDRAFT_626253 [Jaapia argillacea MUCL 33604]|uniref:Uncharacterized protein n=1 Tax=Jaapia argillacea MUCL 33604 TaxID=933084 RepID=A0A067QAH8_9AGAM|nr:hypothetical protein JAAARDRAFT_626253 [Jaapia argillacea MUCL 33604]